MEDKKQTEKRKRKVSIKREEEEGRKKKKRTRPGAGFLDVDGSNNNNEEDNDDPVARKSGLLPMLGEEELHSSTTSKPAPTMATRTWQPTQRPTRNFESSHFYFFRRITM